MPLPRIAIVGRPNAGKSSLMNMIAGSKVSIVDPTPGVTRDRVSAIVDLDPPFKGSGEKKPVEFVDTGGFGVYVGEGGRFDEIGNDLARLTESIEFQIASAVDGADLILFAIDAQAGVTPADEQIARMLREGGFRKRLQKGTRSGTDAPRNPANSKNPPVRVVATKVDGPRWEAYAAELSALGFGEPLLVSAKNNYMRREFQDTLYELMPFTLPEDRAALRADLLLAIVGKRNAGKSTLVNSLAGEERVIASEIPGTTRDAVDVRFEIDGKSIIAIDTAGLRRKKSFQDMIEHFAYDRVQRSVDRCDVVLVLLDATEKISQVDEQLAMLAQKSYKPCVIVLNKWDMVVGQRDHKGHPITTKTYETYIRDQLRGLWYAPISVISGSSGRNVRETVQLALELREQSQQRVTTGKLNRLVRAIVDQRGPTDLKGRFAKIYYVAQTGVEPPTITMVVNHPEMFTPNYLRFLSNRFREELPFPEVPIRVVVRERRQQEDELVRAGEAGEDATIRVSRGRKGVAQRLGGNRFDPTSGLDLPEGDEWLSDEHSAVVIAPHGGEENSEAADAFMDEPDPQPRRKTPKLELENTGRGGGGNPNRLAQPRAPALALLASRHPRPRPPLRRNRTVRAIAVRMMRRRSATPAASPPPRLPEQPHARHASAPARRSHFKNQNPAARHPV
jgi:GTPase